jgi:hypothetical protein
LVFSPGLTRGNGPQAQLTLPPSAQIARFEMPLTMADEYPLYRAALRRRGGEEVLSWSNLRRRRTGSGYGVSVEAPASALAVDDYELALQAAGGDQAAPVIIGYYYFRVQRR